MIKELNVPLGNISPATLDPPQVGVPAVAPGQVLVTGYYIDQATGQLYYCDAALEQWYYYAAGYLYPLGVSWKPSPSPVIDLIGGDRLRLNLTFKYQGPAQTRRFRAALGDNSKSGWFNEWTELFADEKWYAERDIPIPRCDAPTLITERIDITIPTKPEVWGDHHGKIAAAYCKIEDGLFFTEGENITPYYYDVCYVVKVKGEFSEFAITKFEKVV